MKIFLTIIRLLLSRILFSIYCALSVWMVKLYLRNNLYWLLLIPVIPLFLETIRAAKNWNSNNIEITAGSFKSVGINLLALVEDIEARGSTLTRMVGVKIPQFQSTPLNCLSFCVLQYIKIILSLRQI